MILNINGLSFGYSSRTVLDSVEFSVKAGELLAILGPNGVGKTSLLKCINAIHRPSCGDVLVNGNNIITMTPPQIAREVGYVAQRTEAARLTVYDAVLMGRKPHIRWNVSDEDLRMVDAALNRLELTPLALRHIDELSGGELQKVAVARTLVQEPQLLLLDEPTSSLDLRNQVAILRMVRRVVTEHSIAAVMTMHDLNMALRYADSFLFLKNGSIYAHGRTSDVTPEMVEDVYGLPVEITYCNGCPVIIPQGDEPEYEPHHTHTQKEHPCPAQSLRTQ